MKSTRTSTYQATFFLHAINTYLALKDKITKVNLTQYDYRTFGKKYIGLRVDYLMSLGTELTEKENSVINRWDSCLEIYLGKETYKEFAHIRTIEDVELDSADREIKNLIKLLQGFCENVVIDEEANIENDEMEIKN